MPSGKKIGGKADFFLGAADAPIDPAPDWKPAGLKAKVEGGASFAQTQFCMDAGVLRRYTQRLKEEGVLPGLSHDHRRGAVPLRASRRAGSRTAVRLDRAGADDRAHGTASDPVAEGKAILSITSSRFRNPGVAGAHIMAPNNDDAVPDVIEQARRVVKNRAVA